MKNSRIKILFLIVILIGVFVRPIKAQNITYAEQKARKFYDIFPSLVFVGDEVKNDYNVGLYNVSEEFEKYLIKYRKPYFITGNKIIFKDFNPFTQSVVDESIDILIVGKDRNFELDDIYESLLEDAKNGASVALFTSGWEEKDKVVFNFFVDNTGQLVKFEYNSYSMSKLNISVDVNFGKLKGVNLSTAMLLNDAQKDLEKTRKYLLQKQEELDEIAVKLGEQQKKVDAQKQQIQKQQDQITKKQVEIQDQQNRLKELQDQMSETKRNLDLQRENILKKDQELKEKQTALFDFQNKMKELQKMFESQKRATDEKIAEIKKISAQIDAKKKELGNLSNTIKIQRYALYVFSLLLAMIIFLVFWVFRNYRKMKHQNLVLEQQKSEIEEQTTELEKVNTELEKLSIVASKTNNAVSILDDKGRFDWVNSGFTKLYGYTLQLLSNEIDDDIKNSNLYEGIGDTYDKVISTKNSAYFEHKSTTRDKKTLWIQTSITPILDYENKVKRVVLVDSDITDLKEAEIQIAQHNKNIKKSIHYASRIQTATLPSETFLNSIVPDNFVLYIPRDIVSGDFYWAFEADDKKFFAAADCTGHGVPGAFMSMLGITLLNEIVSKKSVKILKPSIILDELRRKLIRALGQDKENKGAGDGIAIAMCMLDLKNEKLHYAGAENEMIIITNDKLIDYIADDMAISQPEKPMGDFTNHIIDYKKGDIVYLFSDGYVDQFGGPTKRRKKFFIKRLRELFMDIYKLPLQEQKNILLDTHIKWKGTNNQLDDIIIMGVKL